MFEKFRIAKGIQMSCHETLHVILDTWDTLLKFLRENEIFISNNVYLVRFYISANQRVFEIRDQYVQLE
jgi:hypothetical protein